MTRTLSGPGRSILWSAASPPRRVVGAAAVLVALTLAHSLPAQTPAGGTVAGTMVTENGKAIRYALVTLAGVAGTAETLTDARGAFELRNVSPGEYRLRLERVGFANDSGTALRVAPGDRLDLHLAAALQPLRIPPSKSPSPVCYPGAILERNPTLAALWAEARKAGRARRAFDLSYSYSVLLTEELGVFRRVPQNIVSDSDRMHVLRSTPALARALAARGSFAGYGVDMDSTRLIAIPEMLEVLDEGFLRRNCLVELTDAGGERRIRFRPLNPDPSGTDLIGNVILDGHYALRRIEFEYQRCGSAFARGWAEFGDGGLPGGQVTFARVLHVEMVSVPRTEGEWIELDPAAMLRGERALAEMKYTDFARDTASAP